MMTKNFSLRQTPALLTTAAFVFAAAFALLMALFVGSALEGRSERHVQRALTSAGLEWTQVSADGLLVTLSGTAPTEAMRFRAAMLAGRAVGTPRILDEMDVVPAKALIAPRFSLELLRNDDGVSVIGLAPEEWDTSDFLDSARQLAPSHLTNMVETSAFPAPEGWDAAIDFGLVALKLLPRSKISLAADGIEVTAISDSPEQKRRLEADLAKALPQAVPVKIDISAPRPVIAPFTFRFVKDSSGPHFDACAADNQRSMDRILAAAAKAGVEGNPRCTLGLGAPSPRWTDAAEAVMTALSALEGGTVTISDVDVTMIADSTVSQADFDRVVGELTAKLPDVFSLKATLTPKPQTDANQGPVQFTATLSTEGKVELRGLLGNERMRDVVEAFARARFGASNVYVATRLDEGVPIGWGTRVMSGLSTLAELNNGSVLVQPDVVELRGITGNQGARAEISRQLSDRLGQGARFRVEISYDERFDPARGLPTPEQCIDRANAVLDTKQISFAPSASVIEGDSIEVLDALAKALADCAGARLEIGGHTDSQGRAETNLRLSQERAQAVLEALSERAVDTATLTARGYGAAEPIADNKTEQGRVANRRIELRLLSSQHAPRAGVPLTEENEKPEPIAPGAQPIPMLDPEEGEPMGDGGDILVDDNGNPIEPTSDETAAPETNDPDAAAPAPQTTSESAPATTSEDAASDDAENELPEGERNLNWQPNPDHNSPRPLSRPQELAQ